MGISLGISMRRLFLDEIDQTLEARFRVANYLMAKEWDLFVFVIMETDWMQHFLWGRKSDASYLSI